MALLYKNAKKEVDREFDQIKAMGYTPQANEDGKTYSWVNDKGEIYRGKLNPTPGIDADSGFLKRHLTREARQNRLMSEKVTAMIPKKGEKPSSGVSTTAGAEIKAPITKPKTEDKAPEQPARDTGPAKTPTSQLIAGVTSPQIEAGKLLRKGTDTKIKQEGPLKSFTPPKYEAGKVNRTEPYLYYEQTEYQKENNPFERFWRNKYSGTTQSEIQNEKRGISKSIFAGEMVSPGVSRVMEENGKKYVLAKNPDFEQGLYSTNQLQEAETASNATGLLGTLYPEDYGTRSLDVVKRGEEQYVKVGKKPGDVIGNIVTGAQTFLMPGKLVPKHVSTTLPAVWKGGPQVAKAAKATEEAVTGPVSLIPKAQTALSTAKTATTSIGPAGGSKLAMPGLAKRFAIGPAKLVPQGTEMATTTWNAATNPYRFVLKAPKALGPGYKCGGKLKPKMTKGKGK